MDVSPGSAEWTRRLTASRVYRLFGGPSAWQALRRDMTSPPAEFSSMSTAHGIENEPRARALYEIETGYTVRMPGFLTLPGDERIGATVDGLVDPDGMIEIKCPVVEARHHLARQGVHDEAYYWQMQHGMWVTGRQWCDFVSFMPDIRPDEAIAIVRMTRDCAALVKLEKVAREFLA